MPDPFELKTIASLVLPTFLSQVSYQFSIIIPLFGFFSPINGEKSRAGNSNRTKGKSGDQSPNRAVFGQCQGQ